MPRMQIYLPDELYQQVKKHKLPASELLQEAVRAELRRRRLLAEADRYMTELIAEVGEPSADDLAYTLALVRRLQRGSSKRAG